MVTDLAADVAEVKTRVNAVLWLLAERRGGRRRDASGGGGVTGAIGDAVMVREKGERSAE